MIENIKAIIAESHTPEYLMHKYWARKPHNVISYFLENLVPENGIVVDPFCGSGVTLNESKKLGLTAYGFDVNPVANLISTVLVNPPQLTEFKSEMDKIFSKLENEINQIYTYDNKVIKYVVHELVTKCPVCNKEIAFSNSIKKSCPYCNAKLRFNLENLVRTEVINVFFDKEKDPDSETELCLKQKEQSNKTFYKNIDCYNYSFTENRRILSFNGLETKNFFTPRNFSILAHIANEFDEIKNEKIRNAAKLLLSASIAQCSRLIPTRNNLSTGGPAWSVPGFWVPCQHLETNPIVPLKARYNKYLKALANLNESDLFKVEGKAYVTRTDAISGLTEFAKTKKADLIFFDPPYGDSVPYLEFSAIWNSFLKESPNLDLDISVSDRKEKEVAWKEYYENLTNIIFSMTKCLNKKGKLLITFNNNDIKAWEALLIALQKNNFICDFVTYQIPAVISSKAQFSLEGSYISDIYSIYHVDSKSKPTTDIMPVIEDLKKAALSRKGEIAENLANRVIMLSWLKNNIDVSLLNKKDDILNDLFDKGTNKYIYKEKIPKNYFSLEKACCTEAKKLLSVSSLEWNELYKNIASQFSEYGFLDTTELRFYLNDHITIEKGKCTAYKD